MKILNLLLLTLFLAAIISVGSATKPESNDTSDDEIAFEFSPFIRVYKNGTRIRLIDSPFVPPSNDSTTGVSSKDVTIDAQTGVSARLYLPNITNLGASSNNKLPLVIYFHGGGFCIGTAFSPLYSYYVGSLVAAANVIAVSVDYRLVPDYDVPIAHEDSWAAVKWVLSHANGNGNESWINEYADFERVFLAGDSAGANIAHNMAIRAGITGELNGVKPLGLALVNPYFWGVTPIGGETSLNATVKAAFDGLWLSVCPTTSGCDDPLINPLADPNISRLACRRVEVFIAEKDPLRDRGLYYYAKLVESGWNGLAEIRETKGQGHDFHLLDPDIEEAKELMKQLVYFLNLQT